MTKPPHETAANMIAALIVFTAIAAIVFHFAGTESDEPAPAPQTTLECDPPAQYDYRGWYCDHGWGVGWYRCLQSGCLPIRETVSTQGELELLGRLLDNLKPLDGSAVPASAVVSMLEN